MRVPYGGGTGDTIYRRSDISAVEAELPYAVIAFRQR